MTKVLNIEDRLEEKKRKKEVYDHRHKLGTLQRVVQCASCHFRCAMCSYHLEASDSPYPPNSSSADFHLCESCRSEFEDFLKMKDPNEGSHIPWHNKEWKKMWSVWIDYQQAIREFRNSEGYKRATELLPIDE
ncbi:MAG: hypothetical protein K8R45_03385 [Desulfobacterales bacterium]|nr:hypothetical protein [Desulfobacterales bacterium]